VVHVLLHEPDVEEREVGVEGLDVAEQVEFETKD
jgi:hypothetical protein